MTKMHRQPKFCGPLRGKAGIALIEVMMGMIMLLLCLLMLLPMMTVAIDANINAERTREAHVAIQNRMEEIRSAEQIVSGHTHDSLTGMSMTWWTEPQTPNMDKVIVEVCWFDDLGSMQTRRDVTYVYKKREPSG